MVFIIAEIGINHNGDIKIAKELIKIAKLSGCDAVKFQKRNVEIAYSKEVAEIVGDIEGAGEAESESKGKSPMIQYTPKIQNMQSQNRSLYYDLSH